MKHVALAADRALQVAKVPAGPDLSGMRGSGDVSDDIDRALPELFAALVVDGEPVIEGPVFDPRLYTITPGPWGPVETVMVPILPILLDRIAHGASVDMVLGDAMRFGSIAPNAPASVTC